MTLNTHDSTPRSLAPTAIGFLLIGVLVALGDIFFLRLIPFFILVLSLVVIRRLPVTDHLADLVEVVVLFKTLWLLLSFLRILYVVPMPFPMLLVALLLVGYCRYLHGRSAGELYLAMSGGRSHWIWILPLTLLSLAGLHLWYHYVLPKPHPMSTAIPDWPIAILLASVPIVALANALCEEFFYRGLIQSEATRLLGGWPAVLLQAVLFATSHYRGGFPNGWSGVGLTLGFGLVMGILTHRARSVWPAVLIHALCDAYVVATMILDRPV